MLTMSPYSLTPGHGNTSAAERSYTAWQRCAFSFGQALRAVAVRQARVPTRERELTFEQTCPRARDLKETLMRMPALAIFLTTATVLTAAPARAQTYDPAYPVCLHVYGRGGNYYECRYTSLPQCNASASGRAAQCVINPYFASARLPAGRLYRRVY